MAAAAEWVNTSRLTAESLVGKVVLVDFCTYTCINWLRTLPHIRGWAAKYKSHGLIVIGVHTPEFAFEHDLANVRPAIAAMKLEHPFAIDNDYAIWRAFNNNYWPARYFIDARGRVRDHHFGEGEYESSERTIQRLLTDAGAANVPRDLLSPDARGVELRGRLGQPAIAGELPRIRAHRELRVTRRRGVRSASGLCRARAPDSSINGRSPASGRSGKQGAVSNTANGRLACRFHARDLHLVMGSAQRSAPVRFRLTIDGQPPGAAHGSDVDEGGNGVAADQRLYQLIRQPMPIADRLMQIEFLDAGAEIFAFTFG